MTVVLAFLMYPFLYYYSRVVPNQFGMIIPNHHAQIQALMSYWQSFVSIVRMFIMDGSALLSIIVGAFALSGMLSCLENDDKNKCCAVYFKDGFKKFFKAFLGLLVASIILYVVYYLLMLLLMNLSFTTAAPLGVKDASNFYVKNYLISFLTILVTSVFVFVPFEGIIKGGTFGSYFANGVKKAVKVYLKLVLATVAIWIVYLLIMLIFGQNPLNTEFGYIAAFVGSLLLVLGVIFFYYPLYKNATDLLEGEKTEEPVERVHKTEYIGSDNFVFHKTTCFHVKQIAPGTEDYFETREEAIEKGFEPCKHCRP